MAMTRCSIGVTYAVDHASLSRYERANPCGLRGKRRQRKPERHGQIVQSDTLRSAVHGSSSGRIHGERHRATALASVNGTRATFVRRSKPRKLRCNRTAEYPYDEKGLF